MTRKRQRGVKASAPRLHQALEASGLKTQTALAERIADLEGLETSPRALVNKVFRGESVDPRTLQRVAAALDVEAWTLYANGRGSEASSTADPVAVDPDRPGKGTEDQFNDDQARDDQASDNGDSSADNQHNPGPFRRRVAIAGLLAALLLIGIAVVGTGMRNPGIQADQASQSGAAAPGDPIRSATFVVLPVAGDSRNLHAMLQTALEDYWSALPVAIAGDVLIQDAQKIAAMPGVDYVLELRISTRGRWQGLLINLHQDGSMRAVWQTLLPLRVSPMRLQHKMVRAAADVVAAPSGFALESTGRDALRKVLVGRDFLDRARTPGNVRRALTEFESAIRLDEKYAAAYAGLCEALVVEHIRSGEMARLDEATGPCRQALTLEPDLPEARVAQTMLDRKRGRHADAMDHLQHVLEESPQHADAAMGMAEALLGAYARGEDDQALEAARELLRQAARAEPGFWKIPYQQSRLSYMAGDLPTALQQLGQAEHLDANLLVLNNLGAMQYCTGDFAAAGDSFLRAGAQDPDAFVGPGQMAVVDYQLGRFDDAVEGYDSALQRQRESGAAEDHRLWGNYADALRHAGRLDQARQAYATAIALVERHLREGDGQPLHAVSRLYYQTMQAKIDPDLSPPDRAQVAALTAQSDGIDPMYKIYLAIVHQELGDHEQGRMLLDAGAAGCPGLAMSPDVQTDESRTSPPGLDGESVP